MGRACYVIRNDNGGIARVLAPNGNESRLYRDAMAVVGDQTKAASVWGTAYSEPFLSYFGDWRKNKTEYDLDENGEPRYEDVINYIKRNSYAAGTFMPGEVMDINNALTSTGIPDIKVLGRRMSDTLFVNGDIFLNDETLKASRLYTNEEMARILSDPDVRDKVRDMIRRVVDYSGSVSEMNDRDSYFLSTDELLSDPVYADGYDAMGKRKVVSPAEIRMVMRDRLGGIKDRDEFDLAFSALPYPSLVDRYQSDLNYADEIYDQYSPMTRMRVVDTYGNDLQDPHRKVLGFFHYSPQQVDSVRNEISGIIDMDEDLLSDIKGLYDKVRSVAMMAADIGIDISDVVNESLLMAKKDQLPELMASFDIALSSFNESDIMSFVNDLYMFTGKDSTLTKVTDIVTDIDAPIVYAMSGTESPATAFANGLLRIGRDIYHKTTGDVDIDSLYGSLADLAMADPRALPYGSIPEGVSDRDAIVSSLRSFVISQTSSTNTEAMILSKIAYGYDIKETYEKPDVDRELKRYTAKTGRNDDMVALADFIRTAYIKEKIKGSGLYNDALKFLEFTGYRVIRLNTDDPMVLKGIEMSLPEGRLRDSLYDYAMNSVDSSMRDLFYLDNGMAVRDDIKFRRRLYQMYPGLLREVNGGFDRMPGSAFMARGRFDNFVTSESGVYEKVGETTEGGIYRFVDNLIYSNPDNVYSYISSKSDLSNTHSDTHTLSAVTDIGSLEKEVNEYTRNNRSLMDVHSCF